MKHYNDRENVTARHCRPGWGLRRSRQRDGIATPRRTRALRLLPRFLTSLSLRAKFLAITIPLTLVSTTALICVFLVSAHRAETRALEDKLAELAAVEATSLAGPLRNDDRRQISLIAAAVAVDPDVAGIVVYDVAGDVVERLGTAAPAGGSLYRRLEPIEFERAGGRQRVGQLELTLTDRGIRQATRKRIVLAAGVVGLLLLAVVLSIVLAHHSTIGIPLTRLLNGIQLAQRGGAHRQVRWSSSDELGTVISAFNEMQSAQQVHEAALRAARDEEAHFLDVANSVSSELQLDAVLRKIIAAATELLGAERGSLFLHDESRDELWSRISEGAITQEIRIPAHSGLAGACFSSGEAINVADAYADSRFNRDVDARTGHRTRSVLCVPVRNKQGKILGVLQLVNKIDDRFGELDIARIRALSAQFAIALENAKLFEEVLNAGNYNKSILTSLTNGVITVDSAGRIATANPAACRITGRGEAELEGQSVTRVFSGANAWIAQAVTEISESGDADLIFDTDIDIGDGRSVSVNMTGVALVDVSGEAIGVMLVFEDISREKRVKSTMARYLSGHVVDQLLEAGDAVLGGTTQEVAILFSDVRQFTSLSERLGPRGTVSLLNAYFSRMADIVFSHNGVLDKYIGDAIMAVFGTPFASAADTDNALSVATEMIVSLGGFNEAQRARGEPTLDIGIGIACGDVVVGKIGSPLRMDYTVIGDPVNLAARLESVNKLYDTKILLSEDVVARLQRQWSLREVDLVRMKGKDKSVSVFESLEHHTDETFPNRKKTLEAFARGLAAYRGRQWDEARSAFARALAVNPHDGPSKAYIERCAYYAANPPAEDWDGVWVMQTK